MAAPFATLSISTVEEQASGSEVSPLRQQRRAHLAPEVLRARKLAAGEWVLLRASGEPSPMAGHEDAQGWVAAQLWPRVGLDEDSELWEAG
jgi:AAA family ATPase